MLKKTSGFLRRSVQVMLGVGVMVASLGVSHAQSPALAKSAPDGYTLISLASRLIDQVH